MVFSRLRTTLLVLTMGVGCQALPEAEWTVPNLDASAEDVSPTDDSGGSDSLDLYSADTPGQSATCATIELLDLTDWTEPRGFVVTGDVSMSDSGARLVSGDIGARLELPIMPVATTLQIAVDFKVESGTLRVYFRGASEDGSTVVSGTTGSLTLQGNPADGLGALVLDAAPGSVVTVVRLRARWCDTTPRLCDDESCPSNSPCVDAYCNPLAGCGTVGNHDSCDDGVACTIDACTNDGCVHNPDHSRCPQGGQCTTPSVCDPSAGCSSPEPIPECCVIDADCDDGLLCTGVEACVGGTCVSSDPPDCSDGEPCNGEETCDETLGCVPGVPLACDNGDICDGVEICKPWEGCVTVGGLDCDDGSPCTLETCHPQSGCLYLGWVDCSDGDLCNGIEVCDPTQPDGAQCVPGVPLACDDGLPCTGVEVCDPVQGCLSGDAPTDCCTTDEDCNDANICTGIEICDDGTCVSGPSLSCDDGNACNGLETCHPLLGCQAAAPIQCDNGTVCDGLETCVPALGCVAGQPLACDDGNVCNGVEGCDAISGCLSGQPFDCDNDDMCDGLAVCDPDSGQCANSAPLTCDDGLPCNGQESCDAQTGCIVVSPPPSGSCCTFDLDCDDGNVCNGLFTCDVLTGSCQAVAPPLTCDGDACIAQRVCDPAAGCVDLPPIDCDDGNICTLDTCESDTASCVHTATDACDDGNPCTVDLCNPSGCEYEAVTACCVQDEDCDDGDPCSDDVCTDNVCQHIAGPPDCGLLGKDCLDGEECASDTCDPELGCATSKDVPECATDEDCDDDSECTINTCSADNQCEYKVVHCDDSALCTLDTCAPETGCVHTEIPGCCTVDQDCDDESLCTTDTCSGENQCQNTPVDCDDDTLCTADTCAPETGCAHTEVPGCCTVDQDCDDGSLCTTDTCSEENQCQNTPVDCDDDTFCTADTCAPETGCAHTNIPGCCTVDQDCDDESLCTTDTCSGENQCQNTPVDCDDNTLCTADTCAPETGCAHTEIPGCCTVDQDCDDGSLCTTDTCSGENQCQNTPVDCDDDTFCTADTCAPETGCAHTDIPGCCTVDQDCDDGSLCTTDTCSEENQCEYQVVDCDDGALCTTDTCAPETGCAHTEIPGCCTAAPDCDDDNLCTTETCSADDQCEYAMVDCDDGDVCTQDSCAPELGCVNAAVGDGCCTSDDDCLAVDVCSIPKCDLGSNSCTLEPVNPCDDDDPCTADSCDDGACVFAPIQGCCIAHAECDDGDSCNGAERCVQHSCATVIPAPNCDDGDACTIDDCDAAIGCRWTPTQCDDGDPCNGDETCHSVDGCQAGAPPVCGAGQTCTGTWSCTPFVGCTQDEMPPAGCCSNHADCDDGDPCNGSGYCDFATGTCQLEAAPSCDDGEPCNGLELCVSGVGCTAGTAPCASTSACIDSSSCTEGECQWSAAACDDGIPCTVDSCDPSVGCVHVALSCDDGDVCNGTESCAPATGECTSTPPLECDDQLECNGVETCDPLVGCQIATGVPPGSCCTTDEHCDDGDLCNGVWECGANGTCTPISFPPSCDGGCGGVAVCVPFVGCEYTGANASCDDDNPCTLDLCVDGGCANQPLTSPGSCLDVADGTTACIDGVCTLTCDADHFDLDGNPQNGCETGDSTPGNVLWVHSQAEPGGNGTAQQPFNAISAALAHANGLVGSVRIFVRAGVLEETFTVDRANTLIIGRYAATQTAPHITGAPDTTAPTIVIAADNVTIQDLVLDGVSLTIADPADAPLQQINVMDTVVRSVVDTPSVDVVYGIQASKVSNLLIFNTQVESVAGSLPQNDQTSGIELLDCSFATVANVQILGADSAGESAVGGDGQAAGIRLAGCEECAVVDNHVEAVSVLPQSDGFSAGLYIQPALIANSGIADGNTLVQDAQGLTADRYVGVYLPMHDGPAFGHSSGTWNTLNGEPIVLVSGAMGTLESPIVIENLALTGPLAPSSLGRAVVKDSEHVHLKNIEVAHQRGFVADSMNETWVTAMGITFDSCEDCQLSHANIHDLTGAGNPTGVGNKTFGLSVIGAPLTMDHVLIHDIYEHTPNELSVAGQAYGIMTAHPGTSHASFVTVTRVGASDSGHSAVGTFSGELHLDYSILADIRGDCLTGNAFLESSVVHGCTGTGGGSKARVLHADPRFADPDSGEFSLDGASPAIDFGLWNGELACAEPGDNGCVPNSGAYGGTPRATAGVARAWRGHCPCTCEGGGTDCWPKHVYVADAGDPESTGESIDQPTQGLAAALGKAGPGAWVGIIGAVTHNAPVTQSGVRLVGLYGGTSVTSTTPVAGLQLDAMDIRVEDLGVLGTGVGIEVIGEFVELHRVSVDVLASAGDADIIGILGNGAHGLFVDEADIRPIVGSTTGKDAIAAGILLEETTDARISSSTIQGVTGSACGSTCEGGDAFGILLRGSTDNIVEYNTVGDLVPGDASSGLFRDGLTAAVGLFEKDGTPSDGNTASGNTFNGSGTTWTRTGYGHYGVYMDDASTNNVLAGHGTVANTLAGEPIHYYTGLTGTPEAPIYLGNAAVHGVSGEPTNRGRFVVQQSSYVYVENVDITGACPGPGGSRYNSSAARGIAFDDCTDCSLSRATVTDSGYVDESVFDLFTHATYGVYVGGGRVDMDHLLIANLHGDTLGGHTYGVRVVDPTGASTADFLTVAQLDGLYGSGVRIDNGTLALTNSIIASVTQAADNEFPDSPIDGCFHGGPLLTSVLVFECTFETTGGTPIESNPAFVDPAGADFRLEPDSPAIDAGTGPGCEEPEPNGCTSNLGYYGSTTSATSATGAAHCTCGP